MIHVFQRSALIFSINFFVFLGAFCQTSFKGRIVNSNAEGIPFAHIVVYGTQLGTYSNDKGYFNLNIPAYYAPEIDQINITCVGYIPLLLNVYQDDLSQILLHEDVIKLAEVEITPKDHAKDLVLKSIQNIQNNYSGNQENYVGFSRETLFWEKCESENPLYVAEAVIESSKEPYFMTSRSGHVRLIEGRKYVSPGLDTLSERIIGGVHHVHRFDVIARKEEFVSDPDRFYYELVDTTRFNNSDIYEVEFSNKNQSKIGSIFIEDSTFVITSVVFLYESDFPLRFHGTGRTYLKYEANYYRGHDDKWRLARTYYATAFKRKSGLLKLTSSYVTTEIKQSNDIPYTDRIQIGDVYLDKTGIYNSDFWLGYNVILPDENTENLFRKKNISNASPKKESIKITKREVYNLLSKMKLGYACNWSRIKIGSYNLSYTNSAIDIQSAEIASKRSTWALSSFFLYEFKPNIFIGLVAESSLTKTGISLFSFSISKDLNLNPKGRPIVVSPGLKFGYQQFNKFINNYSTESDYNIQGKSFNSGKTDVFLTQKQIHLQPNLMLSIEKSNRLSFFTSINFNFSLDRRIGLTFIEKDELLFREKQFLRNGQDGLRINGDHNDLLNASVNLNLGIFLRF